MDQARIAHAVNFAKSPAAARWRQMLGAAAAIAALAGCAKLTEPPAPEPVESTPSAKPSAESAAAEKPAQAAKPPSEPAAPAADAKPEPPFAMVDVKVGLGVAAKAGDTVSVHYRGTLQNGTEFDASRPRGEPFSFVLGAGRVIQGWDKGVAGMKAGGTRKLTIPSALAYGPRAMGDKIPASSTLLFDVELLKIESGPAAAAPPGH